MCHVNGSLEENDFSLIPHWLQRVIDKPKQVYIDSSSVKEKAQQNIKKSNLRAYAVSEEVGMASIIKPAQLALNTLPH